MADPLKLSELDLHSVGLVDGDYFVGNVTIDGVVTTVRIPVTLFKALFALASHTHTPGQVGLSNVSNIDTRARSTHIGEQAQSTVTGLVNDLASKADAAHNHDSRYYTETEVDGFLASRDATLAAKADLVGGLVPTAQLPALAITEYLGQVASQSAMLALVGQKGDWCNRSDAPNVGAWIITGNDGTLIGNWTKMNIAGDAVASVNGQTGTVVLGKADVGLSNADNTSDVNKPVSTAQQTALNLKANLESPALTGNPTAATQSSGDNSNRIATTNFVTVAVTNGTAGKADKAINLYTSGLLGGGGNLATNRYLDVPIASQVQAQAGMDNATAMTPLRVAQAIAALAPGGGGGGAVGLSKVLFVDGISGDDGTATGTMNYPFSTIQAAYDYFNGTLGVDPISGGMAFVIRGNVGALTANANCQLTFIGTDRASSVITGITRNVADSGGYFRGNGKWAVTVQGFYITSPSGNNGPDSNGPYDPGFNGEGGQHIGSYTIANMYVSGDIQLVAGVGGNGGKGMNGTPGYQGTMGGSGGSGGSIGDLFVDDCDITGSIYKYGGNGGNGGNGGDGASMDDGMGGTSYWSPGAGGDGGSGGNGGDLYLRHVRMTSSLQYAGNYGSGGSPGTDYGSGMAGGGNDGTSGSQGHKQMDWSEEQNGGTYGSVGYKVSLTAGTFMAQ